MTEQAKRRKGFDLYLPFKWFNKAWWALAELCVKGAAQHNDGPPQWDRHKSFDHESACLRHFSQLGEIDDDGIRHSVKCLWRIAAIVQLELEAAELDPDYYNK